MYHTIYDDTTEVHEPEDLYARRQAVRTDTLKVVRRVCLVPALAGLVLLVVALVQPMPNYWQVVVGMIGMVPWLATWTW